MQQKPIRLMDEDKIAFLEQQTRMNWSKASLKDLDRTIRLNLLMKQQIETRLGVLQEIYNAKSNNGKTAASNQGT